MFDSDSESDYEDSVAQIINKKELKGRLSI